VPEGLLGEDSIAELCRREGLNANVYYRWSIEFLEAGKKRLSGDTQREATTGEVNDLRGEAAALKEALADAHGKSLAQKKRGRGWGRRYMRYSAAEKYEVIQLVERSDLSVRKTLAYLDIHRSTFYNWLQRYRDWGVDGLNDRRPDTGYAWNKIPEKHHTAIIDLAQAEPQLSPRELAVTYTDDKAYFV
jgi:putative transposase